MVIFLNSVFELLFSCFVVDFLHPEFTRCGFAMVVILKIGKKKTTFFPWKHRASFHFMSPPPRILALHDPKSLTDFVFFVWEMITETFAL